MKTTLRLNGCLLVAAFVTSCAMVGENRGGGSVQVSFENPAKFTDMSRVYPSSNGADEGYLDQLREHVQRTGAARIPAGHTLALTITDVDMAGEFEPHRGPRFSDVRIVRSIYMPRITLRYRLTDTAGAVLTEGERVLSNPTFDWTSLHINRDDPLRYEKDLLDEFLSEMARSATTR